MPTYRSYVDLARMSMAWFAHRIRMYLPVGI